jgi:acetylornithine deacetylase/succinyl-diaminopimelate desuccinylase-like protein
MVRLVDATPLLQRLIRFNTVNPPGDERAAQEFLGALLEDAGLRGHARRAHRAAAEPGRPAARRAGRPDAVPALARRHRARHARGVVARPWSGDEADGLLWGRGALDMKSQTAARSAPRSAWPAAAGVPRPGDLLVVVVVDEETGGAEGAQWICEEHPDLVRCDFLLNEGGGAVIPYDGRRVFGVCVAEKGVFRFRLTTDGSPATPRSRRSATTRC